MSTAIKPNTIVNCGFDWITVTFKPDSTDVPRLMYRVENMVQEAKRKGEPTREFKPQGYLGCGTENVFFGGRADGYMLLLTSSGANEHYKWLLECLDAYNVTRADLQVSVKREDKTDGFANRYRTMVRKWELGEQRERFIQLGTVDRVKGGDSLTIFPRVSEVHFRIYDKSHEQKGRIEPGITRFEGEFKGDTARTLWGTVKNNTNPHMLAKRLIATRLQAVGITEPWMAKQSYLKLPVVNQATDNEKRLDYLETVVKGMLDKLTEAGLREEALKRLGISGTSFDA